MAGDFTEQQSTEEQLASQQLSLGRTRAPTEVPGYRTRRFLGAGAYGEVWVAEDVNTGRLAAIKFYAHRGGLDWSLLSREVEKLVFLSADRYVVQLFDVGWDADPPYYVMEYVEWGSLEDRLRRMGRVPADEAAVLFREIAIGLTHAHEKGVLHCDLKPANVLLDQDARPRLADFGQSRLSHEQTPSLGTLFYMAPEQADLSAMPDARWDVYGLGALLYCMLVGEPPRRSASAAAAIEEQSGLEARLDRYRTEISEAPPLRAHRKTPGCDRALAEILERCLEVNPKRRFPNVQAVLEAMAARARQRARRPQLLLGAILPAVMLVIVILFAWQGFDAAMKASADALTQRVLRSNQFAAEYVAESAARSLEDRYREVVTAVADVALIAEVRAMTGDPAVRAASQTLRDPSASPQVAASAKAVLKNHPSYALLQDDLRSRWSRNEEQSWFITDNAGVQIARVPEEDKRDTIGVYYGWRTYFNGGERDLPPGTAPPKGMRVEQTHLSAVFRSQASGRWIVAISTPLLDPDTNELLGVVALTLNVGDIVEFQQRDSEFPVLVDARPGDHRGQILQHRDFEPLLAAASADNPADLSQYRLAEEELPTSGGELWADYRDPLDASDAGGEKTTWLAAAAPVEILGAESGWWLIVQQSYQTAIGGTLQGLQSRLFAAGLTAVGLIAAAIAVLWLIVARLGKFSFEATGGYLSVGTSSPSGIASATLPFTRKTKTETPDR